VDLSDAPLKTNSKIKGLQEKEEDRMKERGGREWYRASRLQGETELRRDLER